MNLKKRTPGQWNYVVYASKCINMGRSSESILDIDTGRVYASNRYVALEKYKGKSGEWNKLVWEKTEKKTQTFVDERQINRHR